jgi:hypothetical protein
MDRRAVTCASAERIRQVHRPAVLLEQVRERLLCQFLKSLHLVAREQVKCLPGLIINLHSFARHQAISLSGWQSNRSSFSNLVCFVLPVLTSSSFIWRMDELLQKAQSYIYDAFL